MAGRRFTISALFEAIDRITAPVQRIRAAFDRLRQSVDRTSDRINRGLGLGNLSRRISLVGGSLRNLGSELGALGAKFAVAGAAFGYAFTTQFIDVNSQFENLKSVLGTLESGDQTKVAKSFEWIKTFTAKTPYELDQVSEAFVRLRSYGIDPIANDSLRILGDTAAGMDKPLMQAVEAIADATTGENDRLKEFGIKAAKDGNKIAYEFTDKAGKQQKLIVDKNNRELIQKTLLAIMNSKYKGAMEGLSKTWTGMVSNLSDTWAQFMLAVGDAGAFEFLKGKIKDLLDLFNRMAADGSLQKWAKDISDKIILAYNRISEGLVKLWGWMNALKDAVGGWGNLAKLVFGGTAAIIAGPLLLAIAQLGKALVVLARNPVMLAIAGAAYLAYKNIDSVKKSVDELYDKLLLGEDLTIPAAEENEKPKEESGLSKTLGLIVGLIEKVIEGWGYIFDLLAYLGQGLKNLYTIAGMVVDLIILKFDYWKDKAIEAFDIWKNKAVEVFNNIISGAQSFGDQVVAAVGGWVDAGIAKFTAFKDAVIGVWTSTVNFIKSLNPFSDVQAPSTGVTAPVVPGASSVPRVPGLTPPAQRGHNGPLSDAGGASNDTLYRPLVGQGAKTPQPETKVAVTFTDQRTLTKVTSNGPVKTKVSGGKSTASNNVGQNRRGHEKAA